MPTYCITGTNRGIGLEFVRQIAAQPDNTVIATTRPGADRTDLAANASAKTHIFDCDTSSVPSIHVFANKCARFLDGQKIDFLLNSAAVNGSPSSENSLSLHPGPLAEQMSTNVVGPAKIVEFLIDHKALSSSVRILNMSSGMGSLKLSSEMEPPMYIGYSITKAALNMLTVHQAHDVRECLPKAVVVAMDPGWVKTRMGGEGALLEPADSVSSMLTVLHGLEESDNASFFGRDGQRKPW